MWSIGISFPVQSLNAAAPWNSIIQVRSLSCIQLLLPSYASLSQVENMVHQQRSVRTEE